MLRSSAWLLLLWLHSHSTPQGQQWKHIHLHLMPARMWVHCPGAPAASDSVCHPAVDAGDEGRRTLVLHWRMCEEYQIGGQKLGNHLAQFISGKRAALRRAALAWQACRRTCGAATFYKTPRQILGWLDPGLGLLDPGCSAADSEAGGAGKKAGGAATEVGSGVGSPSPYHRTQAGQQNLCEDPLGGWCTLRSRLSWHNQAKQAAPGMPHCVTPR